MQSTVIRTELGFTTTPLIPAYFATFRRRVVRPFRPSSRIARTLFMNAPSQRLLVPAVSVLPLKTN